MALVIGAIAGWLAGLLVAMNPDWNDLYETLNQ
jgi:uncharacterized membrane protein YeaQ/YmgE (transglycosylase-associated protein family)